MPVKQYYIDLVFYPGEDSTSPFTLSVPSVMCTCSYVCYNVKQIAIDSSACLDTSEICKTNDMSLLHMWQFRNKF